MPLKESTTKETSTNDGIKKSAKINTIDAYMKPVPPKESTTNETAINAGTKNDVILYGRHKTGPAYSRNRNAVTGKVRCYGCNQALIFVREHTSSRNGIMHPVKPFYRHKGSHTCDGETIQHRAAKHAITTYDFKYVYSCPDCDNDVQVSIPRITETGGVREEQQWGFQGKQYALDVGFLDANGRVCAAVEIWHTHKIPEHKQKALTDAGVAWVEVRSREVLDAVQKNHDRVPIARCAVVRCPQCETAAQERLDNERRQREHEEDEVEQKRRLEEIKKKENVVVQQEQSKRRKLAAEHSGVLKVANDKNNNRREITLKLQRLGRAWEQSGLGSQQERLLWKAIVRDAFVAVGVDPIDEAVQCVATQAEAVADGDYILRFGKHTGVPFRDVCLTDIGYVRWLAGFTGYKGSGSAPEAHKNCSLAAGCTKPLRDLARAELKGRCILCFEKTGGADWMHWCRHCWHEV